MRKLFSEYLLSALTVICGAIFILILFTTIANASLKEKVVLPYDRNDVGVNVAYNVATVKEEDFIIKDNIITQGDNFNFLDHIDVKDSNGVDLSSFVVVDGEIDTSKTGLYNLKFKLRFNGKTIIKKADFYVKNSNASYKISGESYPRRKVSLYDSNDNFLHYVRVSPEGNFEFNNIYNGDYRISIYGSNKYVTVKDSDVYVGAIK